MTMDVPSWIWALTFLSRASAWAMVGFLYLRPQATLLVQGWGWVAWSMVISRAMVAQFVYVDGPELRMVTAATILAVVCESIGLGVVLFGTYRRRIPSRLRR